MRLLKIKPNKIDDENIDIKKTKTQLMLDKAIKYWGINDIVTIMLSQKRDKEIIERQRKKLERWAVV